jgi:phosphatidate cytidylyltransferase
MIDRETLWLLGGVLALLVVASLVSARLRRSAPETSPTLDNLRSRIKAWWVMAIVFALALLGGRVAAAVLFGLISFWALREFITLTPTRPGDHRALFWAFFIITPLQYVLVAIQWYGLFLILIPVYAFLLIPLRNAIAGDCERFLERTAKIQWALMVCVFCVSHAPALLGMPIRGWHHAGGSLLLYFVLVVQLSDVLQYVWGKTLGKHKIAPAVSPNKTWEGFAGGLASATAIGTLLWWATPFNPWQAAVMSLLCALMGFAGGLTMSAIKRDRGVKDFGTLIEGHGGVLDRIDSLCFAAPVFYHVTRYWFG